MDQPLHTAVPEILSGLLSREIRLTASRALQIIFELARQVSELHADGGCHGAISPTTVMMDEHAVPHLQPPPTGAQASRHATLSPDHDSGIDRRQIDIDQLGTLLCRLLTGQDVSSYLLSPSTKAQVPAIVRPLIERAIGSDGARRFADAVEFSRAAESCLKGLQEDPADALDGHSRAEPHFEQLGQQLDTSPSHIPPISQSDTSVMERAPAHSQSQRLPFERLGHYEITGRIGHGGMGDVYQGYERALKRTVAIKVLPEELAREPEFVRRFQEEAAAAARLSHPNIIQIHFIGEHGGHHYFAMQFVDGPSLAVLLNERGQLTVDETLTISEQVLSALSAAHKQGMVHRDIKPGNILIDRDNRRALVADFGLVKLLHEMEHATATGVIMGTVDYLSPEQGRGHAVDGRSDLYSVGVLMYQMLSGRLPFQADSPTAMIFQHVYEQPPPLAEAAPSVPPAVARAVEKLLRKSPSERYQSADEALAELRSARTGQPGRRSEQRARTAIIQAPEFSDRDRLPAFPLDPAGPVWPGWWQRTRDRLLGRFQARAPQWAEQLLNTRQQVDGALAVYEERRRNLAGLIEEADDVLGELRRQIETHRGAAGEAQQGFDSARTDDTRQIAGLAKSEAERIVGELVRQAREQQDELEEMQLKLAQFDATLSRLRNQRDVLNARLQVARARYSLERPVRTRITRRMALAVMCGCLLLGGLAWGIATKLSRSRITTEVPHTLPSIAEPARLKPTSSPLQLPDGSPGEVRRFAGHTNTIFDVAVCPGGHYVLSGGLDKTLRLWDVETGEMVWMSLGDGRAIRTVAISPDGQSAVAGTDGANILMFDLQTGVVVRRFTGHSLRVVSVAFTPQGTQVLSASEDRTVRVWDASTANQIRQFEADPTRVLCATFSQDGIRALIGGGRGVSLWNVDTSTRLHEFPADSAGSIYPNSLAISPDGRRAIIDWANANTELWDLESKEPLHTWKQLRGPRMTFSPHGPLVLSVDADGFVRLWNLSGGTEAGRFGGYAGHVRSAAFLPDGRFAVSGGGDDHTLRLWRLWPEERLRFTGHAGQPRLAVFSPDGRHVASAGDGNTGGDYELLLWDAATGQIVQKLGRPDQRVVAMAFNKNGSQLTTAQDHDLCVWDLATGIQTRIFRGATDDTESLSFSPDERFVVNACAGGQLILWDVASGKVLRDFAGHSSKVVGVAFSFDGTRVYSASWDKTISAWNVESGDEVFRVPVSDSLNTLAISPDRRFLFTASRQRLQLWSTEEGIETARFAPIAAGSPQIRHAALSPDGQSCATIHEDSSIWLWNTSNGEVVHRFAGHRGPVTSLSFSPDSRLILSSGNDGTVRIWQSPLHPPEG